MEGDPGAQTKGGGWGAPGGPRRAPQTTRTRPSRERSSAGKGEASRGSPGEEESRPLVLARPGERQGLPEAARPTERPSATRTRPSALRQNPSPLSRPERDGASKAATHHLLNSSGVPRASELDVTSRRPATLWEVFKSNRRRDAHAQCRTPRRLHPFGSTPAPPLRLT